LPRAENFTAKAETTTEGGALSMVALVQGPTVRGRHRAGGGMTAMTTTRRKHNGANKMRKKEQKGWRKSQKTQNKMLKQRENHDSIHRDLTSSHGAHRRDE